MTIHLDDPNDLLIETLRLLEKAGVSHALYGGLALAVYGVPRETGDVDVAILHGSQDVSQRCIMDMFPNSKLSIDKMRFGGLLISRITVVPAPKQDQYIGVNTVDLIAPIDVDYASRVLQRSLRGILRDTSVSVVSPEDFIVMKCLSTRDKDLWDAASVYHKLKDRLDAELIQRELSALISSFPVEEKTLMKKWQEITQNDRADF